MAASSSTQSFIRSIFFGTASSFSGFTSQDLREISTSRIHDLDSKVEDRSDCPDDESLTTSLKSNMADPLSNYIQAQWNKRSVTLTLSQVILPAVRTHLSDKLTFFKEDTQNGIIYKGTTEDETQVTVTLYSSTNKLHVQGEGYSNWTESFLLLKFDDINESNTDPKEILVSQPRASTPVASCVRELMPDTSVHNISDVVFTAISPKVEGEIYTLKAKLAALEKQLCELQSKQHQLGTPSVEKASIATQTTSTTTKTAEVQCQTQPVKVLCVQEKSVQCDVQPQYVDICTQEGTKPKEVSLVDNLSNITDDTYIPGNDEANVHHVASSNERKQHGPGAADRKPTNRAQTLIIGSSLLKGIKTKGLKSTHVRTYRGARINTIRHQMRNMRNTHLSHYKSVIFLVGGNDYDSGRTLWEIEADYNSLIQEARHQINMSGTDIYVSGLPPRANMDVRKVNTVLRNVCEYNNITFISQEQFFVASDGAVCKELYYSDGVHLRNKGTVCLLANMDVHVSILKTNKFESYCRQCGEDNHTTAACKYDKAIKCHTCKRDGHKGKFCHLYN